MTNKRKTLVLTIALIMSFFLSACTVSEKDKSAIFKCMKKENLIQVNDMDFDDYSNSENVSNAPVPGYTEYYTYENGNTSYRICFEGYYVEGEGKKYTAFVRETNGNEETSQKYYFAKTKILKRMKLTDSKYSFYEKTYEKDEPLGIQKVYYNGSTVTVAIGKDPEQFKDDKLLQCAISLLNNEEKTPISFAISVVKPTLQIKYMQRNIATTMQFVLTLRMFPLRSLFHLNMMT